MRFSLLTSIYAEINKINECLRGHGHIKSVCRAYIFFTASVLVNAFLQRKTRIRLALKSKNDCMGSVFFSFP